MYRIPFNRPGVVGTEFEYMTKAVTDRHLAGDGPYTRRCQALLEASLGVPRALMTTSCTHALEMAALLLEIQPGDEVIVPAFTFVSCVNAFVLRGACPVFADIRRDTLNLDESQLERLVTGRTKAIVVVHYAGIACEMDTIMTWARRHNVRVVEDNAHGLFATYHGQHLGTFGSLATQSFHETKNLNCGEGGALLINDAGLIDRAEILREKGTNRSQFFRGEVDKYTWVDVGSSYLPSELLAAFLLAQLEAREQIQAKRGRIWRYYDEALRVWAHDHGIKQPCVPRHCGQPFHMYYLLMPSLAQRQQLIDHLKGHGILSVFHYLPLHLSQMGRGFGGQPGDCPVTEDISDRLLRLPFFFELSESDQAFVVDTITAFRPPG